MTIPPLAAGNAAPFDFDRTAPHFVLDRPGRPTARTSNPEVLSPLDIPL
jgi:hypothetical protein